jgi:hypothetical protein
VRRLTSSCALWLLLLAACESGTEITSEVGPAPSPTPTHACADEAGAIPKEGSLEGDVDGDGTPDIVTLLVNETGAPGCKAFVVVDTADEDLLTPIADENIEFALGFPTLNLLAEIDDQPGMEVVVDVTAGASTAFAGVFSASGGALDRIRLEADALGYGDLFPYGGSVGHLEASDCAPDGGVVVSVATPKGKRYQLKRSFFSFTGPKLGLEDTERRRIDINDLQRFPEFAGPPFASCD